MNGSGISYEDVITANVRNQKDKEIENLKQEIERLNNIINKAIEILDIYGTSNYETADLLYSTLRGSDK